MEEKCNDTAEREPLPPFIGDLWFRFIFIDGNLRMSPLSDQILIPGVWFINLIEQMDCEDVRSCINPWIQNLALDIQATSQNLVFFLKIL